MDDICYDFLNIEIIIINDFNFGVFGIGWN